MNRLRPLRSSLRCLAPRTQRRCIQTSRLPAWPAQRQLARPIVRSPPSLLQSIAARTFSRTVARREEASQQNAAESEDRWANTPAYEMTFSCKQCNTRSSHKLSKQGYHHGTVLITCPGCKSRHLISDHLKIFSDTSVTLEDIMKKKGQLVRRGTIGADGDIEFLDDDVQVSPENTEKKDTAS